MTRIMMAGDLHKRAKDITTITGYTECALAVQRSLMKTIKDLGVNMFISLGDWYDRGYGADIAKSLVDYDLDLEMARMLNGEFYGVIGNHIRLNEDSNPELHLIQPHPVHKSRKKTTRTEQIMRTPDMIRVQDVQFSLMHHNKDATSPMDYIPKREAWAKYHIALFHTPYIVPKAQLEGTTYCYNASPQSQISQALKDVDVAIVGDIHNPLGSFRVSTGGDHKTLMIVPGSLTNTDAGEQNRHTSIAIPIIDVDDESRTKLSFCSFDLLTNMVTFTKKNVENTADKLRRLAGKPKANLYETDGVNSILGDNAKCLSLNAFMQAQDYTSSDKALVRSVIMSPEKTNELVSIYFKEEQ